MTGDVIRVGLVGMGAVARAVHLPLLTRRTDLFAIVGICDLAPEACDTVARRFGIPVEDRFDSLESMLDGAAPDAVMVLSSGPHEPAVVSALRRELPVFCEKPLAYTVEEADRIAAALGDRTDRLMVGYMKAYDPAVARARELTKHRPRPRHIEVNVFHPSNASQLAVSEAGPDPGPPPTELAQRFQDEARDRQQRALGGAAQVLGDLYSKVLLGSLSHELSVLRALGVHVGDVTHAHRWAAADGPGSVEVLATSQAGTPLSLRWHYLEHYPAYREEVRWHDEQGSVELVFPSPYLLHAPTILTASAPAGAGKDVQSHRSPVEAFEEELVAFHEMLTKGSEPRDGMAEGRADLTTCQRIIARIAAAEGVPLGGEASAL